MPERPHGYARYKLDGCRCYVCGWAVAGYNDAREQAIRRGTWQPFTDAAPARAHVEQLLLAGIGTRGIAALAGVERKTVGVLLRGRSDRGTPPPAQIRPATAAAILGVRLTLDVLPPNLHIASTGTVRRLQALVRRGWPQARLAAELGMLPSNLDGMLDRDRCRAATARKVAELYRRLENADPAAHGTTPAAITRAVNMGRRRNWAVPAMWDDDTIDDPGAHPDFTGECGTGRGARLHRSRGLWPVCDPCRTAEKEEREQGRQDEQNAKEAA